MSQAEYDHGQSLAWRLEKVRKIKGQYRGDLASRDWIKILRAEIGLETSLESFINATGEPVESEAYHYTLTPDGSLRTLRRQPEPSEVESWA